MRRLLALLFCAAALASGRAFAADASNAILRLLNSRASGSMRGYAEAAEEVAKAARANHPVYAYVLALVSREDGAPPAARLDGPTRQKYLDGCREAIRRQANTKNNPMAWYLLSLENNDTNLLCRAAVLGNIQAMNAWGALSVSLAVNNSTTTNELREALATASGFFRRAAGEGDANGLYNLGMCHWRGLGMPPSDIEAFRCFRAAAEKGHPEAINNIGAFFREGRVVERDLELATKWFEKSASFENAFGQFNYALALQRGEGVKKDVFKAASYLKKAADGGCVEAMDAYGVALWKGLGVNQDPAAAFRLFVKAAQTGYPPAMENVSTCYDQGRGVPANAKKALEWKIRSRAACGDRNAQAWLQQNAGR